MSFDLKVENNDLVIGEDGDLKIVEDSDKLIQDILKIILTPLGSNRYNPAYGSLVNKSLVGNVFDQTFTFSVAENQIKDSLETFKQIQKQQISYQYVSASEQLAAVKSVTISRALDNPLYYRVVVAVVSNDLSVLKTSFEINVIN